MTTGKTRPCERCGRPFVPANRRQRFCDLACGSLASQDGRRVPRAWTPCAVCERPFIPANRRQRMCSVGCRARLPRKAVAV